MTIGLGKVLPYITKLNLSINSVNNTITSNRNPIDNSIFCTALSDNKVENKVSNFIFDSLSKFISFFDDVKKEEHKYSEEKDEKEKALANVNAAEKELAAANAELMAAIKEKNKTMQMEIPSEFDDKLDVYANYDPMTAYCQSLSNGKYTDTSVAGYQDFVIEYTKNILDNIKNDTENNTGKYLRLHDLVNGGDITIYKGVQGEDDETLIYNNDHRLIADTRTNSLIEYNDNGCISKIVRYLDYTPIYNNQGKLQQTVLDQPSLSIEEYIYDTDENGKITSLTRKEYYPDGNPIEGRCYAIMMNSDGIISRTKINMSDYWLQNQIVTYSFHDKGKNAIKNAIKQDKNGDYIVSLYKPVLDKNENLIYDDKGIIKYEDSPTEYRVTQADLFNIVIKQIATIEPYDPRYLSGGYYNGGGGYDNGGDIDAIIIERAMELYLNEFCSENYQLKVFEDGTMELRDYNIGPNRAGSIQTKYVDIRNLGNALFGDKLTTTNALGQEVQIQNKSTQVMDSSNPTKTDAKQSKKDSINFLNTMPLEYLNRCAIQFNPVANYTIKGGNQHPEPVLSVGERTVDGKTERYISIRSGTFTISELEKDWKSTVNELTTFYLEYFEFVNEDETNF